MMTPQQGQALSEALAEAVVKIDEATSVIEAALDAIGPEHLPPEVKVQVNQIDGALWAARDFLQKRAATVKW